MPLNTKMSLSSKLKMSKIIKIHKTEMMKNDKIDQK